MIATLTDFQKAIQSIADGLNKRGYVIVSANLDSDGVKYTGYLALHSHDLCSKEPMQSKQEIGNSPLEVVQKLEAWAKSTYLTPAQSDLVIAT